MLACADDTALSCGTVRSRRTPARPVRSVCSKRKLCGNGDVAAAREAREPAPGPARRIRRARCHVPTRLDLQRPATVGRCGVQNGPVQG